MIRLRAAWPLFSACAVLALACESERDRPPQAPPVFTPPDPAFGPSVTAGSGSPPMEVVDEPRTSRPDGAACKPPYLQVTAGASHTCVLDREGCVVCVGKNEGHFRDYTGQAVPAMGRFKQIEAGREHTCGIRVDGTLACWGATGSPPAGEFVEVSADYQSSCALRDDGVGVCWDSRSPELPEDVELAHLVSGEYHACGILLDGSVQCWGEADMMNFEGEFAQLAAESRETCALRDDGSVDCGSSWLRFGAPEGRFIFLDVDSDSACAIRPDGRISCWGQLPEEGSGPPESGRFVQLSIGREPASSGSGHGCAIDEEGDLHCWGSDRYGQISLPE
jgi:alpha-tubulin suppressor-like RCC1 family protein